MPLKIISMCHYAGMSEDISDCVKHKLYCKSYMWMNTCRSIFKGDGGDEK